MMMNAIVVIGDGGDGDVTAVVVVVWPEEIVTPAERLILDLIASN